MVHYSTITSYGLGIELVVVAGGLELTSNGDMLVKLLVSKRETFDDTSEDIEISSYLGITSYLGYSSYEKNSSWPKMSS
jgi:hypothetical protein